jgi:hypothetical protein|tara:strand:+ start:1605 stop:2111 length:507 start_codon:yes stop_codon:yes gene_type:complete
MKSKLLPILLIVLIVLNGVLIFMLLKKPHEKGSQNRNQRNFLTEQLQFSVVQKEQFNTLEKPHKENVKAFDAEIRRNKDFLFRSFSKKNFKSDSITKILGTISGNKEAEVFHFFQKVRNLCNEEQLKSFDDIIMKALHNGNRRPPMDERTHSPMKRNHPPRDERRPPR